MSVWMWLVVVVSAPIALVATLLGLLHVSFAVGWVWRREESPSALPLIGPLLGFALVGLAFALEPRWARMAVLIAALVCFAGEIALLAARAIMALRGRPPTPHV